MAVLDQIKSELNKKLSADKQINFITTHSNKNIGHRRRDWLFNEDEKPPLIIENHEQSDSKLVANHEQSDSKLVANHEQSDSKLVANHEQSDSKLVANHEQSDSKLVAKVTAEKENFYSVFNIIGQQKILLIFLYEECKKARMENTEALNLDYISSCTNIAKNVVKNALYRLERKNCITRVNFKNGRGGWTKYKLHNDIFHDLFHMEKANQLVYDNQILESKVVAKLIATPSYSSSISSISSTTIEENKNSLPEIWENIETEKLDEIGFTQEHIKQLYKIETLNPEIVQNSIKAFSFDLEFNNKAEKIKGNPLNYIMGILRKGIPYLAPDNYESVELRTMKKYIAQQENEKKEREELLKRSFDLSFEKWVDRLSEEEIKNIIPESSYRDENSPFRKGALNLYFTKNIWEKDFSYLNKNI